MFSMSVDLTDPTAPLRFLQDDGRECWTPYRTADAGHDVDRAAYLVSGYLDSEDGGTLAEELLVVEQAFGSDEENEK